MDLDEWSRRLAEAFRRSAATRTNEAELRGDVEPLILQAARELWDISDLQVTAERRSSNRTRERYDKAYKGLVVEWEWAMTTPAKMTHAAGQALDYLSGLRERAGIDDAFSAVVCDGSTWGFLVRDVDIHQPTLFGDTPTDPAECFEWRVNSEAACRRFLELIGSNKKHPVTARGLAEAFGPSNLCTRRIILLLCEAMRGRQPGSHPDTLFREWTRSIEVVYGNLQAVSGDLVATLKESLGIGALEVSLGELLFAVHTFFATLVKLIAIEVLAISSNDRKSQPSSWITLEDKELIDFLRRVDAGEIPSNLGIQNLFEGDVFTWYLDVLPGNSDLLNSFRETLGTLDGFAIPRLAYGANPATDILRDLYQGLLPRPLRKALGEFLTPVWLAESCLDRLYRLGARVNDGRVIDPTCGTGTFLLPLLKARLGKLRSSRTSSYGLTEVQDVLDQLAGFDINPIAVIAARVNFVLSLGDLAAIGHLKIPIWRADAVLVPHMPPLEINALDGDLLGARWLALRTSLDRPFPIPPEMATASGMALLRECIEACVDVEDPMEGQRRFDIRMRDELSKPEWGHLTDEGQANALVVSADLYRRIRILVDADQDHVWARIIENSFAPLFVGQCDVVVGNPPWLTWTKLPQSWRTATEQLWKDYGLWRIPSEGGTRSRSLASGDIATLVLATSLARYCKPAGAVGMLLPQSLINADPGGRAFRKFHLRPDREDGQRDDQVDIPFGILHIDDWSTIKPFSPDAANTPMFAVCTKGQPQLFPVPVSRWRRRNRGAFEWRDHAAYLEALRGEAWPVDRAIPTSAWSVSFDGEAVIAGGTNDWTFGKGLDTRGANGIYFVRVIDNVNAAGLVSVENVPALGRDSTIPTRRGKVESSFVYPLLRGRNVSKWRAVPEGYIVAPYREEAIGDLVAIGEAPGSQYIYRFLAQFRSQLAGRSTPPTRNWRMDQLDWPRLDGPIARMGGSHIVVVRELQAKPAAAIVRRSFSATLQRTAVPLIDHKLCFCAVESEEEALFLAGCLNSAPIQGLLGSFSNSIAVSPQTLARLPIPPYDPVAHANVVLAARECVAGLDRGADYLAEAESALSQSVAAALAIGA